MLGNTPITDTFNNQIQHFENVQLKKTIKNSAYTSWTDAFSVVGDCFKNWLTWLCLIEMSKLTKNIDTIYLPVCFQVLTESKSSWLKHVQR